MADPTPSGGGPLGPFDARFAKIERRLATLESPSGTQRGQVLSDLLGRIAHTVDGTGTTETWTSPQPNSQPWGPELTFTITEARMVSVMTSVRGVASVVVTNTTTSAFALLRGQIFVNGATVGGAQGEVGTNVGTSPTANRTNYSAGTLVSRSLVALQPGTHTVRSGFLYRNAEVIGTGGSAYVTAADPNIFVDILQTLD